MKIAQVVSTFPLYPGGIGNVAYHNARELSKLGYEVTVFTPDYGGERLKQQKFNIHYIKPIFKFGNAAFCPQLLSLLKGFDIVHLHYPFFGGAEIVWLLKKIYALRITHYALLKLVITYHHDVMADGWKGRFFKWHTKYLMPLVIKSSDKVIVTSFDYAEHSNIASLLEKRREKFIEVPNGVDVKNFKIKTKSVKLLKKYKISKKDRIILFVGGLDKPHYFKGLEYLIRSLRILTDFSDTEVSNFKLLVIGDGDLRMTYEKIVKELNLDGHVIFVGSVSYDELPAHYNLAGVVVLPSIDKSEAFGMVLIEAMASAKPVIASNLPGVRTVVDDCQNGYLVKPKDIIGLGKKISELLSDPKKAKKFGEAGRKKAERLYAWEKIGKNLEKVCLDLLA